ncbi:MAG: ABC transporter permease [Pseudomonadota bacterium]
MLRYTLLRIASIVPTLAIVLVLAFTMVHAAPGGPFEDPRAVSPEVKARLEAQYGLDRPYHEQLLRYTRGVLVGDFGPSYRYPQSRVSELMRAGLSVSFALGSIAFIIGLSLGVVLGVAAALRQNRWSDHLLMAVSMLGISVPAFVVAPVLVLVFAITLSWFPVGGMQGTGAFVLPVIALALPLMAYVARIIRASLLDVLKSQFIRTARAQGLSTWTVVVRYAMKPALIPLVSYLGPAIAGVLTGSVVIEQVFNLPGCGRLFVQGALNRDYTLIMGLVIVYSTLVITLNLLADIAYGWLDPRVRYR